MYSFGVDIAITFATEVSSRSSSSLKWRQLSSRFPVFLNASTSSFSKNGVVYLPFVVRAHLGERQRPLNLRYRENRPDYAASRMSQLRKSSRAASQPCKSNKIK